MCHFEIGCASAICQTVCKSTKPFICFQRSNAPRSSSPIAVIAASRMEPDSDDENLVIGGLDNLAVAGLDHHEPQGAEGGTSPQPNLANAVMPPEMYETEWEAFQLSIQRYLCQITCVKNVKKLFFLDQSCG